MWWKEMAFQAEATAGTNEDKREPGPLNEL